MREKGGVSVYGLGRFLVTLYKEQWERLLDTAGDIGLIGKGGAEDGAEKRKGPEGEIILAGP